MISEKENKTIENEKSKETEFSKVCTHCWVCCNHRSDINWYHQLDVIVVFGEASHGNWSCCAPPPPSPTHPPTI
jgi:hypothetical protein